LSDVIRRWEKIQSENNSLTNGGVNSSHFVILQSRPLEKKGSQQLDQIAKERQADWFKEIKADLVLGEALEVLNDLVFIQSKVN
jgi:hypothetical protein